MLTLRQLPSSDGVHGGTTSYADAADVSLIATYSDELKEAALESAKEFLNSCAVHPGDQAFWTVRSPSKATR